MLERVWRIFKEHIELITTDFTRANHPWNKSSKWVGYTAIFYLLPILFIKDTNIWTTLYKVMWAVQTIFVFSSDFVFGNPKDTPVHGIDRLLATTMTLSMIVITLKYYSIWFALAGAFFPVYFVYLSKVYTAKKDWDKYVFYQSAWHVTGPIIASYVLYDIQKKHKLFEYFILSES